MRRTALRHREKGRAGFTLHEVMIALTMLAIGVLSLAALLLMTMNFGSRGRHATQASSIAQSRMEALQRVTWTDASLQPTAGWAGPTTVNSTVQNGGNVVEQSYDVFVRITDAVPGVSRNIDVRVDWDDQGRAGRSYALSTLRYNIEGL